VKAARYDLAVRLKTARLVASAINYRSHPEMVGDMSHVTMNFELSKIPSVHFYIPGSRPILTPKIKRVGPTFTGSHPRAVTDADDDNAGHHNTTTRAT